ncbi:aftiphilin-like isoform X2 [Amphibalanus amphitrite]|uniref:aftiphilin-like isoform X2 n=1 Tax=Amphibalanus amphitrite TaxID=1232801 RepID=UPI001C8FB959|nr:aftiphilin-like isoform X2 [Amphibalanus amphitrite]XP_043220014.1 aftiphilin-like isoform X2 [Amphibalanus amphitrite]
MFPPMVSASPPPSDDELSGDDGDELGVADSSFDITGLSQKLPVCQPPNHKPPAPVSSRTYSPDPARSSPSPPAVHRLPSDDWGEFSGAPAGADPAALVPAPPAAPQQFSGPERDVNGAEDSPSEVRAAPVSVDASRATGVRQERSIFSDSESDSEEANGPQRGGEASPAPPAAASERVQPSQTSAVIGDNEPASEAKLHREGDRTASPTVTLQNGTDELSKVAAGGDSDSDDFGDFGSFSAATASESVTAVNAVTVVNPVTDQSVSLDSSVPDHRSDGQFAAGTPPSLKSNSSNGREETSSTAIRVSNANPSAADVGSFAVSNGPDNAVNDSTAVEGSSDRIPSPDDGVKSEEAASPSETVDDPHNASPVPETAPSSDSASAPSSLGSSPKRAKSPDNVETLTKLEKATDESVPGDDFGDFAAPADDFGDFTAPAGDSSAPSDEFGDFTAKTCDVSAPDENLGDFTVPSDVPAPDNDFGDFTAPAKDPSAPTNDFGDFAAPSGDASAPTDDFGDFAAPSDDFGDFAAPSGDFVDFSGPAASSGAGWPPDGADGGGGFADFGAVFAAPSTEAPLEAEGQLADPASLSDDDFGDFEDFQAPVPQEPAPITDEAAVSALLARLFPLCEEDREPASIPLDAGGVWYQLRETDATPALQYRWPAGRSYTALLHALRVDASNIINFGGWGGRPSRFGQPLGSDSILQPVRAVLEPTPAAPPAPPSQPPAQQQQQQSVQQEQQPQQPSPPAGGEVPPAAFDWNSAGLKNPLDSTGLERELLSAEEPPAPRSAAADSVLSRLMAQTAERPLSEAASQVVARIPDIDFMQAKVLMFPVRGADE